MNGSNVPKQPTIPPMPKRLKPCPFCGGDAVIQTFTTAMEKKPRYRVKCLKCWCETNWDNWSVDEATDTWNKRMEVDNENNH